ncbi:MAG: methyltransferase domain-containing protein [Bacteroidetes bacterium]|nr:methyltransferase domain-containing protein [Bacteroidota bacterium]MBI3483014.1 methyltransferase domain-containing protein [Bacteroidota bacterium]
MKSIFSERSNAIEIMDDLNCKGEVVDQTLRELEFINRKLGGNQITVNGINSLLQKKISSSLEVIDLGCGGGDMLILLSKEFSKRKTPINLIGVDANPNIIEYAKNNTRDFANINFETINIFSKEFESKTCDVATATLFFHHFTSAQLAEIIKKLYALSRIGIVINDLHRHPLAYYSIKLLTKLFSKSAMVKFDAPLSVLRGFSRKEIEGILSQAGIRNYSVSWRWAFRWEVVIWKT